MLIFSDIFCLAWILLNNKHFYQVCTTQKQDLFIQILICIFGFLFLISSEIAYWLLACRYWEISYQLEEVIQPIGFKERPEWHTKIVKKGMIVWICFTASILGFLYLITINHDKKSLEISFLALELLCGS